MVVLRLGLATTADGKPYVTVALPPAAVVEVLPLVMSMPTVTGTDMTPEDACAPAVWALDTLDAEIAEPEA
jgi:hypothetical protein